MFARASAPPCDDDHHENPTLEILEPVNGSTVTGPDVLLRFETTDFGGDGHAGHKVTSSAAASGHIHLYLDKPATTDAKADTVLDAGVESVMLKGVAAGAHYLVVQGADEDHRPYAGMHDSVSFTVK
jgi:hypothetical protein